VYKAVEEKKRRRRRVREVDRERDHLRQAFGD
jgi:hypothetical protein